MKQLKTSIILCGLVALGGTAVAQEEEAPSLFTYATYFYCKPTGEERADEVVKTVNAPVYDQLVEEGVISRWGWLAHHTGGKWRRIQYYQAPTIDALLDAQEEMNKRMEGTDESANEDFGNACYAHDDYIWQLEGGTAGKDRGKVGFSVYFKCNEMKEQRADELWASDFAPVMDKAVADGKLTSWGWQSHNVGGAYRRLQTMTAADTKALLAARAELIEAMYGNDNKAGAEFTEICGSHSDYIWNIQMETP